jgi:putative endonuclease
MTQAMAGHLRLGRRGEDLAAEFLQRAKMRILERNWRPEKNVSLELDIVAQEGDILHFVEVKSRTADFIPGRFAVNRQKQTHIKRTANNFMSQNKLTDKYFVSFDVVEITDGKIEFLQNCFY